MNLDRRHFLGLGLAGTALLAVGGVGLFLRGSKLRKPAQPLRALTETEFSILAALADRLVVPPDGIKGPAELQVAEKIDAFMAGAHPATLAEFKQALAFIENALAGLVLGGRFSTFSSESDAVQDEILEEWRTSSLLTRRTVYKAINGLVSATYYALPETWAASGYPGPPDFGNFVPSEAP